MSAPDEIAKELALPSRETARSISAIRRRESVSHAIHLATGPSQDMRESHSLYSLGDTEIIAEKPGKEAAPGYMGCTHKDGTKGRNENDMHPDVRMSEPGTYGSFSFENVFRGLTAMHAESPTALELTACLLFRMAFMLDHSEDESGEWRLTLPANTLATIRDEAPRVEGLPTDVFLYLVEVIALNEDVKYFTLGYNPKLTKATGRKNNLLTYCRLCAVLRGTETFYSFAAGFAKPPTGISTFALKSVNDYLPMLQWDSAEEGTLL